MACGRQYCPKCGEELIHRDNRKEWESSSSLGAIIRAPSPRGGPKEISFCDIDGCVWKAKYKILRIIEHKQPNANIGDQQLKSLKRLDLAIRSAVTTRVLCNGSGVFIIRGGLHGSDHGRREVDFCGPQIVTTLSGEIILKPKTRIVLWDWLNCEIGWSPRNGIRRVEYR